MTFVSIQFWALFLPLCFLLYKICGRTVRGQNIVLLIAGIIFYGSYDFKYLLILALSIAVTYAGGCIGSKQEDRKKADRIYSWALVLNLLILVVFKYTGFILGNINSILGLFGLSIAMPKLLLPVGLAFYVFQSSTYLLDLKSGRAEPEKNLLNYSVFVSFFPTVISGPILRAASFLPQVRKRREVRYENFQTFVYVFLWGAFMKLVMADRLAGFVSHVFSRYYDYGGFVMLIHTAAAMLQLYFDFAGYSYMAIAVAALFGFYIPENFRQPWFATSVAGMWRRWHISMTSWFTDYLYIPLGGSRKGRARKYLNTFIVFTVSGLWHGAAWNFALWGFMSALYMVLGQITKPLRLKICEKLRINRDTFCYKTMQRFIVFGLIAPLVVIFNVDNLKSAAVYFRQFLTVWNPWVLFDGSLCEMGMSAADWTVSIVSGVIFLIVSILREKGYSCKSILRQNTVFRVGLALVMFFAIAVFGVYGASYSAGAFVYAGF
ncbi:MAG: MBOAT family O-acyltransferase [Candidatus Limivicinus sp.]|jgi:alginate O-acetyltransferase complex protein AlgI